MKPSDKCINLIKKFEGLYLRAYLDPAAIPTIGYGSIRWPDGKKVQIGEAISIEKAHEILMYEVDRTAARIPNLGFNQNQFDAIVSFTYNVGIGNLLSSTMLKKMRVNINDPSIRNEFMRWTKASVKGKMKELAGLVRRRKAEADLYFAI